MLIPLLHGLAIALLLWAGEWLIVRIVERWG